LKGPEKERESAPKKNIKVKGKELADKIRALRPKADSAQANLFGLAIGVYDTALVTIANLVEGGATLADAVQKVLADIKFPSADDRKSFIDHLSDAEDYTFEDLRQDMVNNIRQEVENSEAHGINKDMLSSIRKLAQGYIENGVGSLEELVDKLHDDLKSVIPDLEKRDVRDAFSGYGEVRQETENKLRQKVNALKKEANLTSQLEDALDGELPKRKGRGKAAPKDIKLVELQQKVTDAMKAQGLQWDRPPRTPREQKQMSVESLKDRISAQIEKLLQIGTTEGGTQPLRKRLPTDAELEALKKIKNDLLKIIPKDPKDQQLDEDAQMQRIEKNLRDQIDEYEGRIKTGDTSTTPKKESPSNREIELLKAQRDALREMYRKFKIDSDPQSKPQKIAIEKYKDSLQNQIINYLGKIETGDFDEREKESFVKDSEAAALELSLKKAKGKFNYLKSEAAKANRSPLQKVFDAVAKYRRFAVLTGIPTMGKITAAVAYRSIGTPVEEIIGAGFSALPGFRNVARQAPRHGGVFFDRNGFDPLKTAISIEGKALMEFLKANTWKDAKNVLKGQGELESKFGRYSEATPEFLEFMGRVHAAFKNFAKRAEFVRAYEKRSAYAMRQGFNTDDELVQTQLMYQAYTDANKAVFMGDNALTKWYSNQIAKMERPDSQNWQKIAAFLARFTMPIVKVPTNFALETGQHLTGLPTGLVQLAYHAIRGELNNLPPDQADQLMKNLKKGTFGAGMFALGFYCPQMAGGYYVKGDKRDEDDVQWGQLEFMGARIPRWATHAPFLEALQFGSTVRRLYDKKNDAGDDNALAGAIYGSTGGLLNEVPLLEDPASVLEAFKEADFTKFEDNFFQSFVPIGLGQVAAWGDYGEDDSVLDARKSPTKRKIQNPIDAVKYEIPGLRNTLDEK
jgi:predicted component of type VI protein secretion system